MRIGGWKLPLERLSATSLSLAVQCPEQFRQKYLLKQEEKLWGDAFIGTVIHSAVEDVSLEPEDAFTQAWEHTLDRRGEPDWGKDDPIVLYKRAKQMVKLYWPTAQALAPRVTATEQRFEETILGVKLVGYIDRELDDRILDVKTAKAKTTKPKTKWSFQGRIYSLVSGKPVEWHVLTKQATPQLFTAELWPDLYQPSFDPDATLLTLQHAIERINDYYARYGADRPWPADGIFGDWLCNYCSFKDRCHAYRLRELRVGHVPAS